MDINLATQQRASHDPQRISQQFWNSEPVYSEPPPLQFSEAPAPVRDPGRARLAQVLFVVVFVPTVVLLVLTLLRL